MSLVSGSMNAQVNITDNQTIQIASRDIGPNLDLAFTIASGTGAGQANLAWGETRTLSGSSEDLDLSALANYATTNLNFASLIGVLIVNNATDAELTLKTNVTNGCTSFLDGELKLRRKSSSAPSYALIALGDSTGAAVGGSTKILRVAGTTGKSYSLILIGRSA